jgi:4-oxalomesaconate tautomerase
MARGSVAADVAQSPANGSMRRLDIEHPTGFFTVSMKVSQAGGELRVERSALLRTARKLMRGEVYVPSHLWPKEAGGGERC